MIDRRYIISFKSLINQFTPISLLKGRWVAWISVLLYPLSFVYNTFRQYYENIFYALNINPQVCFLTKLLNDRYDFSSRRIYIEDGIDKPTLYMFRRNENKPVHLFTRVEGKPKTIYTRGESSQYANDFIIFIPSVLSMDLLNVTALVRSANNLPGTKFKIQLI